MHEEKDDYLKVLYSAVVALADSALARIRRNLSIYDREWNSIIHNLTMLGMKWIEPEIICL